MKPAALALAGLLWCCTAPALAAPGDLDTSFGRHGLVHTNVGGTDFPAALLVQPDRRIVVAGYSDLKPPADGRYGFGQLEFALARYTPTGKLDRTFGGGDGRVTADLGGEEQLAALARQPDGKLIVAGHARATGAPTYQIAVARFTADGQLDPGFGSGSGWVKLTASDPGWVMVSLVKPLPDGKLVLVGRTAQGDGTGKLAFARLLPDGRPDESFAPGGVRLVQFGGAGSYPSPFLLDSRGGVVVGGSGPAPYLDASRPAVVQRFSLDGELDQSFGSGGTATLGVHERGPEALALQGDHIVAAISTGSYGFEGQLVRLSPGGAVDTSFGKGGTAPAISPASLAVDAEGRLIVGGQFPGVVRYDADGGPDQSFKSAIPPYSYAHEYGTIAVVATGHSILGIGAKLARPIVDFEPGDYDFGVVRVHGSEDATAPVVRLRGRRRHGCSSKGFRLRLTVRDESGHPRLTVSLDGRPLLATRRARSLVRVRVRRLRPGTHTLRIEARDTADNVTVRRLRFRRCR